MDRNRVRLGVASIALGVGAFAPSFVSPATAPTLTIEARGETSPVPGDADDCAIWVHADDPARAVVIGTDKAQKPKPGLRVWDLEGREIQFVPVPRPNNVDVQSGFLLNGQAIDIAVCNARRTRTLHVFRIDPKNGTLSDITTAAGIPTPQLRDPYGLSIYRRPQDGAVFVITSTQEGATHDLHQYRLEDDGTGHVKGTYVRKLGAGSISKFVEGIVVDDALGWVYAAEEGKAVYKYNADPDQNVTKPLASFALGDEIAGDREGMAIYDCGGGKGWILLSSQGDGTVKVYRREGEPGNPHKHVLIATLDTTGSSSTDGLDVTSRTAVGFPLGFLAKHDASGRNFVLYSWSDAAKAPLVCPSPSTSR